MLSLFAIPKHFKGKIEDIQRNAIISWTFLKPRPQVILFGDEEGTARLADEFGLLHLPGIARNEYGTPLVDDLFGKAQEIAENDILCYVNADIILLDDFMEAVERISFPGFMMTGQRLDLELDKPLDFSSRNWKDQLKVTAVKQGKLHGHTGLDYFVFSRGLYPEMPPFALGRTMWDNWLIYKARSLEVPVIDATQMINAIHQEHDYSHHPGGDEWVREGPEAERNLALGGGWSHVFTIRDSILILTPEGLKKPRLTRKNLCRQLETLAVLRPRIALWAKLARAFLEPRFFLSAIARRINKLFQPSN